MIRLLTGDCRDVLKTLPDASVHCCITSPPYFGLRDYGIAEQIGLEAEPAAFVAELVTVFREVRRVLRDDGTLWLNLGDSYAGSWGAQSREHAGKHAPNVSQISANQIRAASRKASGTGSVPSGSGLKPKDLMGIPWAVAKALQVPYYAGRIKNLTDRVWLAAMIDGEGCMFIHKRKAGTDSGARFTKADGIEVSYARTADTYGAGLEVANTHLSIIENCIRITGVGSVVRQEKDRRQPLYRWNVRSNECRWVIQEVYPHLVAKQHQARLLLGAPSAGERADAAHQALICLHNGSATDVDFDAPESLFQEGYYLRQDIIWSKLNPMPESVTDRCTKSHEYLFLLSKSPTYYCDMEAIAEPVAMATIERLNQNVNEQRGSDRVPGKTNGTMKAVSRSGNKERKPGSARGCPKDSGSNVCGSVPWEGATRNKRSVWTVTTRPFKEAHFATFPPLLIEPCIKAGCPPGGVVLDSFGGAGTTGLVADGLQRDAVLIELNPAYVEIARHRIVGDSPLFSAVFSEAT